MTFNPNYYTITTQKGIFEGQALFEARVAELPDLSEYAESEIEAYELAVDTILTTKEIFSEKGIAFPAPMTPAVNETGY